MVYARPFSGMIRLTGSGRLLWDGDFHLDSDAPTGSGWDGLWA